MFLGLHQCPSVSWEGDGDFFLSFTCVVVIVHKYYSFFLRILGIHIYVLKTSIYMCAKGPLFIQLETL